MNFQGCSRYFVAIAPSACHCLMDFLAAGSDTLAFQKPVGPVVLNIDRFQLSCDTDSRKACVVLSVKLKV